jgi:predicted outer membrane repeat protein
MIKLIALLTAFVALATAGVASADSFKVNETGDPSPRACKPSGCSLREAVIAANVNPGRDMIVLRGRGPFRLAIPSSGKDTAKRGDLDLIDRLKIIHRGRGHAMINAQGVDRVFDIGASGRVTMIELDITGGDDPSGSGFGGGINSAGDLTMLRSIVRGNRSTSDGGGISFPEASGSLTLRSTTIKGNISEDDGGGIGFDESHPDGRLRMLRSRVANNRADDWGGGAITAVGVRIRSSVFSGNRANDNVGGLAIEDASTNISITGSTFAGNRSPRDGGGLFIVFSGAATIVNSTFSGNHALMNGGGIGVIGSDPVTLTNVTVARNSADGSGGGIYAESDPFQVGNSIIALNAAPTGPDCYDPAGSFDSLGTNLYTDEIDCDGLAAEGDLGTDTPLLGTLGLHGGPTATIPLLAGSPAIGMANPALAPATDQRGQPRDDQPDAGAYER